ncbi:hypothetical protein HZH68_014035 [Vespula germanica]|uniref:Uncharacterized protein n=1 Tax=Vespula germanica TaxID=30212 RepID=A0A834MUF4_VESGE|nr:hypothetical protein HZH68_014035 [Vespula germanica]
MFSSRSCALDEEIQEERNEVIRPRMLALYRVYPNYDDDDDDDDDYDYDDYDDDDDERLDGRLDVKDVFSFDGPFYSSRNANVVSDEIGNTRSRRRRPPSPPPPPSPSPSPPSPSPPPPPSSSSSSSSSSPTPSSSSASTERLNAYAEYQFERTPSTLTANMALRE